MAFSTYLGQLIQPVRRIGAIIPALTSIASAASERVFEILARKIRKCKMSRTATRLTSLLRHVRFGHVSFAYFGQHTVLPTSRSRRNRMLLIARPKAVTGIGQIH